MKELKRVRSLELEERIYDYPEEERDGRSDWQMLSDEAGYMYDNFMEDGHCLHDDWMESKRVLKETKNGKIIPTNPQTMKPMNGYWPSQIQSAKDCVNEVKRIGNLLKRLQKKGIWSKWYQI